MVKRLLAQPPLRRALNITYLIFTWIVLTALCVTVYLIQDEKFSTFEDYVKYYQVVPVSTNYDSGDTISFHSFNKTYETIDIAWQEIVYCSLDGSPATRIGSDETSSQSYRSNLVHPDNIQELLEINDASKASSQLDALLREYAKSIDMYAWSLDAEIPEGSTCFVEHQMRLNTPRFGFPKRFSMVSSSWTYGVTDIGR